MARDTAGGKSWADVMERAIIFRFVAVAAFLIATPDAVFAAGAEPNSKSTPLQCDIGPATKSFGKTQWRVFSCNDHRTVVIVSAPGNPAMPYYFIFSPRNDGYHLSGEGNARKEATAAAFEELKRPTETDIIALIVETKRRANQH